MNRKNVLFLLFLTLWSYGSSFAQSCPPNIDFEDGTLNNWLYFTGTCCPIVTPSGTAPVINRHTLTSGAGVDPLGGFPIVNPYTGSYSLRLGNNSIGAQGERAKYYVHIPPGPTYNLMYHYAVVLGYDPGHTTATEPRMTINAYDSASGALIPCSDHYIGLSQGLTGFNFAFGGVYFRPWTSGNIKLNGLAGHTVIVDFATGDCSIGDHFGYGYVDMNCGIYNLQIDPAECSDLFQTLNGPDGYASYLWLDSLTFSTTFGVVQSVHAPLPYDTITYALIVNPYAGYGCTDTLYYTAIPPHPLFHQSPDDTICFGTTLTLTSGATSPNMPLTYSWSPSSGVACTTCDPMNVTPPVGVTAYTVTVTDGHGCTVDTFITITTYPTPAIITGSDSVCKGLTTVLSDAVLGGKWSSSNTTVAKIGSVTGVVSGLTVGTSVITYSFGGGLCYTTTTVTVNPLPTSFSGTTGTCIGGTTTLSNAAAGGIWSSSNTAVATVGSTTGVVSGVSAGTVSIDYQLTTTGCMAGITVTIVPLPVVSVTQTHTSCKGMKFTATGSYSSYNWDFGDGISGIGNPGFHTYSAYGTYVVTLTEKDIYNCSSTDTIHVSIIPPPLVDLGNDTTLCSGPTITLQSLITYTTSPTYSWSTGATTPTINVTTSGVYSLTVTEGFCSATDTVKVNFKPFPVVNLGNDTAFCIGVALVLSSPQPPGSTYLWNTGSTATSITATLPGTYWLRVSNGCVATDTIHIALAPPPLINIGPDTLNCTGSPVTLNSAYTYPPGTTYQWSDGSTTPALTVPLSGLYWLKVSIAGCTATDTINVGIVFDTLTLYNNDTAICRGKTVQALLTANPVARFSWLPTAGIASSHIACPLIAPDTSALYQVLVDIPGCPTKTVSFFIDVQPNPFVYIGGNRAVCEFDTLHVGASVTPRWFTQYKYSWTPPGSLDDTTLSTVLFTASDTTEIKVVVSTSAGCTGVDSALFIVYPGNFASIKSDTDVCPHDTVYLQPKVTIAGINATYHWYPSSYLSDPLSDHPWLLPITSQVYTVLATSQYGCKDTVQINVKVHPDAVLMLGDSTIIYPGESYQISPQTNCSYFSWFPPQGLDNPNISNPVATPQTNTYYIVHGTTEWGCRTADSINVYVSYESLLSVPNAFIPASVINGKFFIIKRGQADLNYFRIFDRWGNKVFDTKNIDEGWDGKYNGTAQPFGVYVYEIEAVTSAGTTFRKHGNVTLIR